ncbi:MAG: flagellar basal body P-ring formation chaperone FlgA [Hyphomicrobium sp.]
MAAGSAPLIVVPVAVSAIYPGAPIRDDQIVEKNYRSVAARAQIVLRREDVVGKVARRVILPGQPILLMALKDMELVTAGQSVTLMYAADGVEITGRAVALQAGKKGETISVRNIDSGVAVRAVVAAEGFVTVGPN